MASKNEIKHRISLEGDEDVKRRLKAVGEAGKQALTDTEKRLDAAKRGAGGKPVAALSEAIAPLTEASGLAGVAGIFGRLSSSIFSPTGLIAGITSALLGMAKLGDETQRQKDRFKSFGDAEGFAKVSEQAKKLGTDISSLQQRRERYVASVQEQNAKNLSVSHPPGYVPGKAEETAAGVRILGAGPSNSAPPDAAFQNFDRALFELIRKDVGDADRAHQLAAQFEDELKKNGLTGDSLRSLRLDSPSSANFITKSMSQLLGRGFANPAELAALLDRGTKVSQFDLVREGAKRAPEADKEAKDARGVSEAFDAVRSAAGRLATSVGGDHAGLTKGIDSTARLFDEAAGGVEKFLHAADNAPGGKKAPESLVEVATSNKGDLLGRLVGYIRQGSIGGGNDPLGLPQGNPFGVITSPITNFMAKLFGWSTAATKAAGELSKAAGDLPTVTYGQKKSSGEGLAPQAHSDDVQKAIEKFRHFNGGLIDFQKADPEAAALIQGLSDRGDGSVSGKVPSDQQQLSGMLTNQKRLGEVEGLFQEKLNPLIADQTGEGADSIERERSKQRGIVGGADLSERLYPEGPSNLRYRRLDDPNYQPPELGSYDDNGNFVPAKKQPYPKVPGLNNVYDTKGFGDFNPIYNSGAPSPLSFPHYLEDLRKSLSPESVPLPQSRPDEAPPEQHSAVDDQQEVADNATAFNKALDDAGDGLKRFVSILADVRSGQNSDTEGKPKTVTFATGGPVARWFDGGGHVSGPGTTTSDSIPAWLSDKEYVIQASAAKKVGRGFLDWVNAGAPGFADGGSVIGSSTGGVLGPGNHDITYDPLSGGAYIDGNLHLPGDPVLDDPIVKQAMQESMQGMGQQPSQKKHKSDFTGIFGGHVFDTPGSFAGGGAVGSVPSLRSYFARFADGGSVAGGLNVGAPTLPQISMPTLDFGDVPDFGDLASSGPPEAMHHVTIDLGGGRSVDGLRAPTDIVKQLSREAKDSANACIGVAPSWVYGRGR